MRSWLVVVLRVIFHCFRSFEFVIPAGFAFLSLSFFPREQFVFDFRIAEEKEKREWSAVVYGDGFFRGDRLTLEICLE